MAIWQVNDDLARDTATIDKGTSSDRCEMTRCCDRSKQAVTWRRAREDTLARNNIFKAIG